MSEMPADSIARSKSETHPAPIAPVLKGKEDIVDVHDDSRLETRQYFQEQIIDVAANLHGVGAVDEQDVARARVARKIPDRCPEPFSQSTIASQEYPLRRKSRGNGSIQIRAEFLFLAAAWPNTREEKPLPTSMINRG